MLVPKDRLLGMPIMSLQTGAPIAQTEKLIIDPRQLKVVGFYCDGPRLDIKPAILLIEDIREASKAGFIVDGAEVLVSPGDLVRLKNVLGYNFTLDNKLVVDDTGRKVGKVDSFALDNTTFYVIKLQVRPGVLKAWQTAEVMIDRSQIIEVTDTKVVVKSPTVPKEEPAFAPAGTPSLGDNPFRRPQAENTTPKRT